MTVKSESVERGTEAEPMTVRELAEMVAEMRAVQREYFRDRTPFALNRSKALERQVDQAVAACLGTDRQSTLF